MLYRLIASLCLLFAVVAGCASSTDRDPAAAGIPLMQVVIATSAEDLISKVRNSLESHGYSIVDEDRSARALVVESQEDSIEVRLSVVARGDSAELSVTPLAPGRSARQLIAVMRVMNAATEGVAPESGGFLSSRWRPELFVTPNGRLWLASEGLYSADSTCGDWTRVSEAMGSRSRTDDLRIGVRMGFVHEDTVLIGFPSNRSAHDGEAVLYRSTTRGTQWEPVPTGPLAWVDEIEALGRSVWVFGTRWEGDERRGTFLRSEDAGQTWEQPTLPPKMNDIWRIYRISPREAYVSTTSRDHPNDVFFRTTDGGESWSRVPTPHDQGVHKVPYGGIRVHEIASVGPWLLVLEFGSVFITRRDDIRWRQLDDARYIAADRTRDLLFVLTKSLRAKLLDADLSPVWTTTSRVGNGDPSDIEKIIVRDGTGFISMIDSDIYEAREGKLRLLEPKRSRQCSRVGS